MLEKLLDALNVPRRRRFGPLKIRRHASCYEVTLFGVTLVVTRHVNGKPA